MNYLNPDRENQLLPSKLTMTIRRGDVLRHEVAGAGGWGDPLERDAGDGAARRAQRFRQRGGARQDYGVVVLETPWRIDEAATVAARGEIRARRKWQKVPEISWGPETDAEAAE